MSGDNLLVSIIIPNYNKGQLVRDSVCSAIKQEGVGEVIFVDDGSDDESPTIAQNELEASQIPFTFMRNRRTGPSAARNSGIKIASFPFIIFLDSDDVLLPNSVRSRLEFAQRYPEYDAYVFPMREFSSKDISLRHWNLATTEPLEDFLRHKLPWQTMQPMWATDHIKELSGFDDAFFRLEDPELHIRALLFGTRFKLARHSAPDCLYRIGEVPTSKQGGVARQHLDCTLMLYEKHAKHLSPVQLRAFSGTLFSCLKLHFYWRSAGSIDRQTFDFAASKLVAACLPPSHRKIMRMYIGLVNGLPFNLRGLSWITQRLLARC